MAILIGNMEMPGSCLDCPFNEGEYSPSEFEKRYCKLTGNGMTEKCYKKRPASCPIEEPKHGEWTKISPAGIYECSVCGQNVMTGDIDVYKHCHGCGAKMAQDGDSVDCGMVTNFRLLNNL